MNTYWVDGKVIIEFDDEIEANSPEEAREKFIEIIKDFYRLDTHGAYHNPEDVKIEIYSGEYDD